MYSATLDDTRSHRTPRCWEMAYIPVLNGRRRSARVETALFLHEVMRGCIAGGRAHGKIDRAVGVPSWRVTPFRHLGGENDRGGVGLCTPRSNNIGGGIGEKREERPKRRAWVFSRGVTISHQPRGLAFICSGDTLDCASGALYFSPGVCKKMMSVSSH